MSSIVLSASVRQNLLSLVSTADLLSTTQSRLASGKRVNSTLDNPTNYFTASALDNRASDISNLLDSISNGVQVLQAANTGISSLQTLVNNAKSVTNQALQTQLGYSAKSTVTSAAVSGATASSLLGDYIDATVTSGNIAGAATPGTLLTALTTAIAATDSFTVNGKTIAFATSGGNQISANGATLDLTSATVTNLLTAIDTITSTAIASTLAATQLTLHTGTAADLVIGGNATTLGKLGLGTGGTTLRDNQLSSGLTLTIGATGGGTATSITFGRQTAAQVDTLDELNAALAANNLQATISSAGAITITTSNDAASSTIGTIGGTVANSGEAFSGKTASAPVRDAEAQLVRAGLVKQYNEIIRQITNTAQDASFAGVNLLGRDTLELVFNERGTSTLTITGVNFNPAGLGLSSLAAGTDFVDNNHTNTALAALNSATVALRSEASDLGSHLSIVQARQKFSREMIIVLQTGSANLTLADANEEAANSQALSTRQSIAVSALGLANQSQQSVLQLLR